MNYLEMLHSEAYKKYWERVLDMKFSEPKVVNGRKVYMPGRDTITFNYTPEEIGTNNES